MSNQPELTELLLALEKLSSQEVRYMCVQLGVEQCTLENIDADHPDTLTRIPKYLQAWLDRGNQPSWSQVVQCLKLRRLGKTTLANTIEEKHCLCVAPASPSSHSSNTSSGSSIDLEAATVSTPPQHSGELGSLPSPIRESKRQQYRHIAKIASNLELKFISVLSSAIVCLTRIRSTREKFYYFKIALTRLPLSKRYKRLYFLQKKKRKIIRAKGVQAVFDILDPYWNYVDYSLLEYIVKKYCDSTVKKQMKKYKCKLHKFEKETSVKDYTLAVPDDRRFPQDLSALTATLNIDGEKCSLYSIRRIKESIAEQASLQQYAVYTKDVHASSVVLTIAFPRTARKYIEKAMDKEFLNKHDIIPESVLYGKVCIPRTQAKLGLSIPDLRLSIQEDFNTIAIPDPQEDFDTIAMPDPPQNVMEEVSGVMCTIRNIMFIFFYFIL